MKTTIHTIFAALLTGATLLSSCDDYLTTLPSDSLVSEGAITTEEDTKTAVNGLYEGLISVGDSYYYGTDFITRPEVGGEDIQTRMVGDRTENFYRFTDRQSNARESLLVCALCSHKPVLMSFLDAIESGSIPMTGISVYFSLNNVTAALVAVLQAITMAFKCFFLFMFSIALRVSCWTSSNVFSP